MRTLYVRVVLTFLIVVVTSLAIASTAVFSWFRRSLQDDVVGRFESSGRVIQRLYDHSAHKDLARFLKDVSDIQQLQIRLFSTEGEILSTDGEPVVDKVKDKLHQSAIALIANGTESTDVLDSPTVPLTVGVPFEAEGRRYAMFLTPNLNGELDKFRENTALIVASVLAVGSLLILIAARYLVLPLKQMTRATRRIARGDFNIALRLKRRDELGELSTSIQHMAEELGQIERARQQFVSDVSHEIQSPLTSIRGFARILGSPGLKDDDRIHYASIIEQESTRLSRLGENLLKLASLESEHHPFQPERFRLDRQLRDVLIACEPQWAPKGIVIDTELADLEIVADRDQLSQVWMNLIHNAIKFSGTGGLVAVGLRREEGRTAVWISDQGPGISADHIRRIFDRFYKEDASRSGQVEGNGLGLAIAKKIVDNHEGSIEVDSTPGQGTTVTVRIPDAADRGGAI